MESEHVGSEFHIFMHKTIKFHVAYMWGLFILSHTSLSTQGLFDCIIKDGPVIHMLCINSLFVMYSAVPQ
jgi:hypothetical protein